MGIEAYTKKYWTAWLMALITFGMLGAIIIILSNIGTQNDITTVEIRAAVQNVETTGGGVARIEIKVDSVSVRLEDIAILRARLDSCKKGL